MANIVYRGAAAPTVANTAANKNAALTNDEIDKNFFALNDAAITIGTTAIKPSGTSTTLAGLTSVTATSFIGNASTATTLATARNINGVSFNGSADITVTAAAGTLSGATLASGVLASSLTSVGTLTSLTTSGNVTVGGNLVVNGVTTSINATTLTVDDKNIELGAAVALSNLSGTITTSAAASTVTMTSTAGLIPGMVLTKVSGTGVFGTAATILSIDSATQITVVATTSNTLGALVFNAGGVTDATANGGGITLKGATDKTIIWDSANSNWTSSENLNIASGKVFKISNTSVLSSTTLGSTVVNSSLTKLGTGAGFVKSDASGNLTVDTNTYLTAEADTLATVTGRGATTSTASTFSGGLTVHQTGNTNAYALKVVGGTGTDGTYGGIYFVNEAQTESWGFLSANATAISVNNNFLVSNKNLTLSGGNLSVTGTGSFTGAVTLGHATANVITTNTASASLTISTFNTTTPGNIQIKSGNSSTAATNGSDVGINAGNGTTTGVGGAVSLTGGIGGATARGGHIYVTSGAGGLTSGGTGNIYIDVSGAVATPATDIKGTIYLGNTYSPTIIVGNTNSTTTITGIVKLPTVGTSGFVKLGAGGQLSADTNTYLTAEADTLATVTARGATTTVALSVQGITIGKGNLGGVSSTALGAGALAAALASSYSNTAVGRSALNAATTGSYNTVVGDVAALYLTTGSNNIAVGYGAMKGITIATPITGSGNIAIGVESQYTRISGTNNVALGRSSLYYNQTGSNNTAIGYLALWGTATADHSGSGNVALGAWAGVYENGSNTFYVDNQDRGDAGTAQSNALMYGRFNTTVSSQTLNINAALTVSNSISATSGAFSANISTVTNATSGYGTRITAPSGDATEAILQFTNFAQNTQWVSLFSNASRLRVGGSLQIDSSMSATSGAFSGAIELTGDGANAVRMRNASAGDITFYDVKDPDIGIYNYTMRMDNGLFNWAFSTTNSAYDYGTVKMALDLNGNLTTNGNLTAYGTASDIKLKENIVKLDNCLNKVTQLNGYTFNYIGKTDKMIGVIAQEVEAVAPELVYEFQNAETKETAKAVRYEQITALLIEAIKELNAKVTDLQNQLANK